jgi:hypothetical protein
MVQPVDSISRRTPPEAEPAPTRSPAPASQAQRELDVDALPAARTPLAAFLRNAKTAPAEAARAPAPSPTAQAQAKLDAYRATFAGPYVVGTERVTVASQFRMAGGYNDRTAGYVVVDKKGTIDRTQPQVKELMAICRAAHAPDPQLALMGCASARDLVKVTQALIDAGKLPPGPGAIAVRIKTMQWQWGIGVDCTDYVIGAAMKVAGKSRGELGVVAGTDFFGAPAKNPHLQRVSVADVKVGDVFCLDAVPKPPNPPEVGHRAVVYSHTVTGPGDGAWLQARFGAAAAAFTHGGPVHVIEVESSCGAGPSGSPNGGVRRDTWLYEESSRRWAQYGPKDPLVGSPRFDVTPHGPKDELLHGIYRLR